MKILDSARNIRTLPDDILLKKFSNTLKTCWVGETFILFCPINTINIRTLKRMKIVEEHGQWVAHTKGFNPTSGPSTLPSKGHEDNDDNNVPHVLNPSHDILGTSPFLLSAA